MELQQLREGITQPEAIAIQGMLKSKGFEATISKAPNPNFRIKNPYRFGVKIPEKDLDRAQKIVRNYDDKILRKHTSMIILRSGVIGEVSAMRIARCPICKGEATDPPKIGGVPHWILVLPAMLIGAFGVWFMHRPELGNTDSWFIAGAFFLVWSGAAYIVLLLLLGRGKLQRNIRHCETCNQNWDLEDYLVEGELENQG